MGKEQLVQDFWYRSMPGSMLLAQEKVLLDRILKTIQGDSLLQVGGPGNLCATEDTLIKHKILLDSQPLSGIHGPSIQGDFEQLPIQPESVDVVLLVHQLAFVDDPLRTLKEVYTVLKPSGQLILLGFNAWGIWQVYRMFARKKSFPWQGKFFSSTKIKSWLRAIDFRVAIHRTVCFRPPVKDRVTAKRLLFLENLGPIICPYIGAVYAITAYKKVPGMTPLVANDWVKKLKSKSSGFVEPTTRNIPIVLEDAK